MSRWLAVLSHFICALVRSQFGLACRGAGMAAIENAAQRQQLALFEQKRLKPRLRGADRACWVLHRRFWSGWTNAIIIVKPETVVGRLQKLLAVEIAEWHRRLAPQLDHPLEADADDVVAGKIGFSRGHDSKPRRR